MKGGPAPKRDYFYWELHLGRGTIQALRFGDWKAVRNGPGEPIELYNLKSDSAEANDLAAVSPALVRQAGSLMRSARVDDPDWPMKDPPASAAKR